MATSDNRVEITVGGTRFRLSVKQRRALEERRYSFNEAFADLGVQAEMILLRLSAKGLFNETRNGWSRTALGGRVARELAKRNGGK